MRPAPRAREDRDARRLPGEPAVIVSSPCDSGERCPSERFRDGA